MAFLSDALDDDYKMLVDTGAEALDAPKVAGSGVGRLAFVRDPNGARVELIQRNPDFRMAPIAPGIIQSLDHYSLRANNLAAAKDFYGRPLGMKVLKEMYVASRQQTILYYHYGYDVLELLHRPTPDTTSNIFGHIALRVESVDAALDRFASQGVTPEPDSPKPAGTGLGASASSAIQMACASNWWTVRIFATCSRTGLRRTSRGPLPVVRRVYDVPRTGGG